MENITNLSKTACSNVSEPLKASQHRGMQELMSVSSPLGAIDLSEFSVSVKVIKFIRVVRIINSLNRPDAQGVVRSASFVRTVIKFDIP